MLQPSYLVWGMLTILIILNIIIFFHDPLLYTDSKSDSCFNKSCRNYTLTTTLITFALDMCLFISLTFINPIPYLSKYLFVSVGILYLLVILLKYNQTLIIQSNTNFQPPPEGFFYQNVRLGIRIVILALYCLIILGRFASETMETGSAQPILERLVYSRFGGYNKTNQIPFALSWITFLVIPIASIRLYQTVKFHPKNYDLPLQW